MLIRMQSAPDLIGPGEHRHTCPECYEHVSCEYTCSCFSDMDLDDGTPRGAYVVCSECAGGTP